MVEVEAVEPTKLGPHMNESYTLDCAMPMATARISDSDSSIFTATCTIKSAEVVGAVRGLETLAHLAFGASLPLPLHIADSPRYPYRGLLIDSARLVNLFLVGAPQH